MTHTTILNPRGFQRLQPGSLLVATLLILSACSDVSNQVIPTPVAQEEEPTVSVMPATVPEREVSSLSLDSAAAVYQPGQPVTLSLEIDLGEQSAATGSDDAEDTLLDTDFAKLHFELISKAEDEITPDDIEIGTSYDVADIALENGADNNGVIEVSFQIPDTIEESGTYILLSYAETPGKPLEDATVVSDDLSSQDDVITTQTLEIEIDASQPYHDFELAGVEIDESESALVVDPANPQALDLSIILQSTYFGIAGEEFVDPEEGVKTGEPRLAQVQAEMLINGVWEPLRFISESEDPITVEPGGTLAEVTYNAAGEAHELTVVGTLSDTDVARMTALALAAQPPGPHDPTQPIADIPLQVTIIDADVEGDSPPENDADNNLIETSLPLFALPAEPATAATLQNFAKTKSKPGLAENQFSVAAEPAVDGSCLPLGESDSESFNRSMGSHKNFNARGNLGFRRLDNNSERSVETFANAGLSIRGKRFSVLDYSTYIGQTTAGRRATNTLSLFGQTVTVDPINSGLNESLTVEPDFPLISREFEFFKGRFTIGPIPISVSAGAVARISADVSATISDTIDITINAPRANFGVYLQGGVDTFLAEAGVRAEGTLLEHSLTTRAIVELFDADNNGACDQSLDVSVKSKYLGIKAGLFAKVSAPKVRWCSKRVWIAKVWYPCGIRRGRSKTWNHWFLKSGFKYDKSVELFRLSTSIPFTPVIEDVTPSLRGGFGTQVIAVEGDYLTSNMQLESSACANVVQRDWRGGPGQREFSCIDPVPGTHTLSITDGDASQNQTLTVGDAPDITSITPLQAIQGTPTEFVVSGSNLTDDIRLRMSRCSRPRLLSGGTASTRTFSCEFRSSGTLRGQARNGIDVLNFEVDVLPDSTITNVSPNTAMLGVEQEFTVSGTKLTRELAFDLPGCDDIRIGDGGTSTLRVFVCTPAISGTLDGTVQQLPADFEFSVTIAQPTITAVTPANAVAGVRQNFVVRGTNLNSGLSVNLPGCSNVAFDLSDSSTERGFSCVPDSAGELTGSVDLGDVSQTFSVAVVANSQINSVVPTTASVGVETEFTVTGSDLSDALQFTLDDCSAITGTGGNDTERTFTCTPGRAGTVTGSANEGPASLDFSVLFEAVSIGSVNANTGAVGQPLEIEVRGRDLTGQLQLTLPGCSGITLQPNGDALSRVFVCTPTQTGTLTGSVSFGIASVGFSVEVVADSVITSVTPSQAIAGVPVTLVVTGSDLTEALSVELAGCSNLQPVAAGTAQSRSFQCTPDAPGLLNGTLSENLASLNFTLDVLEPVITAVSPTNAVAGVNQLFTVSGSNLSSDLAFELDGCSDVTAGSGSANARTYSCTPSNPGTEQGIASLGTVSYDFSVAVVPNSSITAVNVSTAFVNLPVSLTVTGVDLTDSISLSLPGCSNIELAANGSATERTFSCTPDAAGALTGTVSNGPAQFEISKVVNPQPVLGEVSPTTLVAGVEAEFVVTGAHLIAGTSLTLQSCDTVSLVPGGDANTRRFRCTPTEAGQLAGEVMSGPTALSFSVTAQLNSQISSIAPLVGIVNQPIAITVTGTDLADDISMTLPGCEQISLLGNGSDTSRVFECVPSNIGTLNGTVTTGAGTVEFTFEAFADTVISNVTFNRGVAQTNEPVELVVAGAALTDSVALSWDGCVAEPQLVAGGTSSERRFSCVAQTVSELTSFDGNVTDGLAQFDFSADVWPAAVVASVTPEQVTEGVSHTFTISGEWLRDGISVTLENCDNLALEPYTVATQRLFSCVPTATGTLAGAVSDGSFFAGFDVSVSGSFEVIRISGEFAQFSQPQALAPIGDMNGDGYPELLIGSPLGDVAYLLWGSELLHDNDFELDLAQLNAEGVRISGAAGGVGWSGASAGDVDGDGIPDLLLGAPEDIAGHFDFDPFNPFPELTLGEAYVVWGSALLAANNNGIDLDNLGANGVRFTGVEEHGRTGYAVSSMGDLNGDGKAEVVISTPFTNSTFPGTPEIQGRGLSSVIWGSAITAASGGSIDLANLGSAGINVIGGSLFEYAGEDLIALDDIDGDGLRELAIGARNTRDNDVFGVGSVTVVWGSTLAENTTGTVDIANLGAGGVRMEGLLRTEGLGQTVANAGDIDGDGRGELLVKARLREEVYLVWGDALVNTQGVLHLSQAPASVALQLVGSASTSFEVVNGGGDIDADGYDDLLIGLPFNEAAGVFQAGETMVIWGSALKNRNSTQFDYSTLTPTQGVRIQGGSLDANLGSSVSAVTDFNRDGWDDIAITGDSAESNIGGVYLVSGELISAEKTDDGVVSLPAIHSLTELQ